VITPQVSATVAERLGISVFIEDQSKSLSFIDECEPGFVLFGEIHANSAFESKDSGSHHPPATSQCRCWDAAKMEVTDFQRGRDGTYQTVRQAAQLALAGQPCN